MTSPATRLLEKRRQLYEISEAFEMQKRRSQQEETHFDKKEKEIRDRDVQLQHQLVRFNKFLLDNEAKRKRAEHRANEEVKEIKQKDEEISDLQKNLENLQKNKISLKQELSQVSCYEDFLSSVVSSSSFSEISDLVARHSTLVSAHQDLLASQRRLDATNEQLREQIVGLRKTKTTQLMALSNEAASLLADCEDAEKLRRTLEYEAEATAARDAEQTEIVGHIFRSIDNIFNRVTIQRPLIQHSSSISSATTSTSSTGSSNSSTTTSTTTFNTEGGFFNKRTSESIARLRCLEAYVRDLREVADLARRETRAVTKPRVLPAPRVAEAEFVKAAALHDRADATSSRVSETGSSRTGNRE